LGLAAQTAPEVPKDAVDEQTQIEGGIPDPFALTIENLWLHDRGVLLQTEVLKECGWGDVATGHMSKEMRNSGNLRAAD